jgi:hypothetical protein
MKTAYNTVSGKAEVFKGSFLIPSPSFQWEFFPKEEQSCYARTGGHPTIPHDTGHSAWMPACAGMTTGEITQSESP